MTIEKFALAVAPVIVGVVVAGWLMNMLRGTDLVKQAINGFDA